MLRFFCYFLVFVSVELCAKANQPLPRFASLRSSAVYLHVGPGKSYPIEWKFVRQHLPLEIIAEFDTWYQVRDHQGVEGWMHKNCLSAKRYIIVQGKIQNIYKEPDVQSNIVAYLEPGVVALVLEAQPKWCKVEVNDSQGKFRGWIERQNIWGLYASETRLG